MEWLARKHKGTVGVIGLGIMGGAFAKNLAAAGWRVVGYDISAARRREAQRAGVEIAEQRRRRRRASADHPDQPAAPAALMATARKIAAAKLPRKLLVEMSTFAISDKEKATRMLRKGRPCHARHAGQRHRLAGRRRAIWCSTPAASKRIIKRLRPMFEAFGRHVYDVGAFGNGSKMKYVANLLVAINNVASAEAMVLGMKAGLPPQLIFDLIKAGAGNSRVFELRAPMMVKGNYKDVTMKIDVWDKDMQVIGDYARKIKVPTPMFNASKPVYIKAQKSGLGAQDTAAVCAVLEKMAKVKRRRR